MFSIPTLQKINPPQEGLRSAATSLGTTLEASFNNVRKNSGVDFVAAGLLVDFGGWAVEVFWGCGWLGLGVEFGLELVEGGLKGEAHL